MNSAGKIVLITGANTGVGFQIVRSLCASEDSYDIVLGGRSLHKARQAARDASAEFPSSKSRVWPVQVDVEDDGSIEAACEEVKTRFGRVDALINNAGAQLDPQLQTGAMTMREVWNKSWDVNTTGAQITTTAFVPLLLGSDDPRLVFVTSGTSALAGIEDQNLPVNTVPPKGWPKTGAAGASGIPAYRASKAGLNMLMREWHRTLRADGVKVWCVSPGYLATGLGGSAEANRSRGAGDPAVAGRFVRDVLEGKRDGHVGMVITRDGVQAW